MIFDLLNDLEGHLQGLLPILAGDLWPSSLSYALEKGLNLSLKEVDLFDRNLFCYHSGRAFLFRGGRSVRERSLLREVVDRDRSPGLEHSGSPGLLLLY